MNDIEQRLAAMKVKELRDCLSHLVNSIYDVDADEKNEIGNVLKSWGLDRPKKAMDSGFALFNCHINAADSRAKKAYIDTWGQKSWYKHIQPCWDVGIMSIFNVKPNKLRKWYIEKVTEYVNENRRPVDDT